VRLMLCALGVVVLAGCSEPPPTPLAESFRPPIASTAKSVWPCPVYHREQDFMNTEPDLRILVFKISDKTEMQVPVPGNSGVRLCVPSTVTTWEWRVPA
jgi:hypothetical protein